MAGLDFLYSPNSQAYEAGQRMANDTLANQYKGLQNQTLEAGLPGVIGNSQSLSAKGELDQAGLQQKMKLQEQEIFGKLDAAQLDQLNTAADKYGQIGGLLEQVPPMLRVQTFQKMAQQYGLPPNIPGFDQLPPEQLPDALRSVGTTLATSSRKHIQQMALEKQKEAGAAERQTIAGKYSVEAAGVRADASVEKTAMDNQAKMERLTKELATRVQAAEAKAANAEQRLSLTTRIANLIVAPDFKTNPEKQQQYRDLMRSEASLREAGKQFVQTDIMSGGQIQTGDQRLDAAVDQVAPKTPTQPEPQIATDPATIKQAFGSYEPNKYIYRVVNGKVQRKPKQ
jgi:hypothetical protein